MALRARVDGVGHYLPRKVVTNDDLSKVMETSDAWITERTGIKTRRIADVSEGTSDLAVKAAQQALARAGHEPTEVDCIIAATLSPDYYFPGIGVLIQQKLGAKTIPGIDIRGQCSGFSWGLATADAYIRAGFYNRILVVGAEVHSRVVEFSNRGRDVSVLFGDAAGAVLLSADQGSEPATARNSVRGIIDSIMGSDGSGAESLLIARPGLQGGHEEFFTVAEAEDKAFLPKMDGRQVFRNAVQRMHESCLQLLQRHNLKASDIDLMIPHQANLRINEMIRAKLELPEEKVFNNIQKYGNTTAATLPLAMYEAEQENRLKRGDLLMTVAFGSGFTWGANLIRW